MTSQYRVNYHLRAHKRDNLIEFIKGMLLTPFVLRASPNSSQGGPAEYSEIFEQLETLINQHRQLADQNLASHSQLSRLVPGIGTFFTSLPLRQAFARSDQHQGISGRRHVPPSFNDVRRILNTAQVMAISEQLELVTFDGDMTLYQDGMNFEKDSELTKQLIGLLERGVKVAIVTAAGYGEDPLKYEGRLSGLLDGMRAAKLSKEAVEKFWVLGGECNFLFQCNSSYHLQFIPDAEYQSSALRHWSDQDVKPLLDAAEQELLDCVRRMNLQQIKVLRKPRAVGLVPEVQMTREQLDECAISAQRALLRAQSTQTTQPDEAKVPFCAFNGGNDCWVDIGNKLIGVQILQGVLGSRPEATLHVGDQFLSTGNDLATRTACCTCWIINPQETHGILAELEEIMK